jgi:putative membrane protein
MIEWRHWHNEPYLVGGLVLLGWLWAICAGPLRARLAPGSPFPRRQAWRFYAALAIFYLAVGSPLDQIGERFLFSAHMLQHFILIYLVPVLFLPGLPAWMLDAALDRPALDRGLRFVLHPGICLVLFTLVVSLWHMPSFYEWALENKIVHVIEHLMFFAAALLYWWPMLSPSQVHPPISHAGQMLYFFVGVITMTPLFAYITFSHDILYPTYEYAPRLFADFSAGEDQLLAGVSMQLMGVAVAMTAFGAAFFRWHAAGRARDEAEEAQRRDKTAGA